MSRGSDQRRREWFKLGVEALANARPDAPRLYCCPLCIRGFDAPEALSFEDAPPQSVGGKPVVLTCTPCNNRHGSELDVHIQRGRDAREIGNGKRPAWAKLRLGENEITTKGLLGDRIELAEMADHTNPAASKAFAAEMESRVTSGSTDWKLQLTMTSLYDEWREQIAWLRVAYLHLFALLGYNYILRPELSPIRDQFDRPSERVVPQVMKNMLECDDDEQIIAVTSPSNLRGFAVRIGSRMHLLPGFEGTAGFYERLSQLPPKGDLKLSGSLLPVPAGPIFMCDVPLSPDG